MCIKWKLWAHSVLSFAEASNSLRKVQDEVDFHTGATATSRSSLYAHELVSPQEPAQTEKLFAVKDVLLRAKLAPDRFAPAPAAFQAVPYFTSSR